MESMVRWLMKLFLMKTTIPMESMYTMILTGRNTTKSIRKDHAGRRLQAELLEFQYPRALLLRREMNIFAMINVTMDSLDMDQFAGRAVQIISKVMELTATSHMLMEEEQEKNKDVTNVRNGEPYGTQNAKRISIM